MMDIRQPQTILNLNIEDCTQTKKIINCDNASCDFWCYGECLYEGAEKITPSPLSNADCDACVPCWFEWE